MTYHSITFTYIRSKFIDMLIIDILLITFILRAVNLQVYVSRSW